LPECLKIAPSHSRLELQELRSNDPRVRVEKLKYTLWAADSARAVRFYETCFGGTVVRQNPHITEIEVAGGLIAIHRGGEGGQTWTGLTFQVADVIAGAAEIVAAGGRCEREPQPENGDPPHLAMCEDTEGNQIMLSRLRE
jgi:lactoylglutathione lyase